MPFDQWDTNTGRTKEVAASISYRRRKSKNGAQRPPHLVIAVPAKLASSFKPKADDRFGLFIGSGRDAGKAQILPSKNGGAKPASRVRGAVSFQFGHVPKLGTDAAEKEYVAVSAIPGGFEITLPAWFVAEA